MAGTRMFVGHCGLPHEITPLRPIRRLHPDAPDEIVYHAAVNGLVGLDDWLEQREATAWRVAVPYATSADERVVNGFEADRLSDAVAYVHARLDGDPCGDCILPCPIADLVATVRELDEGV